MSIRKKFFLLVLTCMLYLNSSTFLWQFSQEIILWQLFSFLCLRSKIFVEKFCVQLSHQMFVWFLPMHVFLRCKWISNIRLDKNYLGQALHFKAIFLKCFFSWFKSILLFLKILLHILHWKVSRRHLWILSWIEVLKHLSHVMHLKATCKSCLSSDFNLFPQSLQAHTSLFHIEFDNFILIALLWTLFIISSISLSVSKLDATNISLLKKMLWPWSKCLMNVFLSDISLQKGHFQDLIVFLSFVASSWTWLKNLN